MRKIMLFIAILSITISSVIVPCFASEEVVVSGEIRAFWNEVINTLSESKYGGAYIKDGVLHIKPIDKIEVQNILLEIAPNTKALSSILLDDEAKYTLSELKGSMGKVSKLWKEFNLNYVSLSEEHNSLFVGAYEWTEEKKKKFTEAIGIENIIFEEINKYEPETEIETINQDENLEKERWLSKEIFINWEPEKGMVVETTAGEIDVKNKPFLQNDCVMIPLKQIIIIAMRNKDKTLILREKEYDKKPLLQVTEGEKNKVNLIKDENRKATTLFWAGNTIVFFEGQKNVWINGNTRYLYTEPYITENEIYISGKDIPTLFCISSTYYFENKTGVRWRYNGGQDCENIEINSFKTTDKKYRLCSNGELFAVEVDQNYIPNEKTPTDHAFIIEKKDKLIQDDAAYMKNGEFMTQIDFLPGFMNNMEIKTNWDDNEKTAYVKTWNMLGKDIVVKAGSDIITVNGEQIKMPVAAEIKEGRIYVPLSVWLSVFEIPQQNVVWKENSVTICF